MHVDLDKGLATVALEAASQMDAFAAVQPLAEAIKVRPFGARQAAVCAESGCCATASLLRCRPQPAGLAAAALRQAGTAAGGAVGWAGTVVVHAAVLRGGPHVGGHGDGLYISGPLSQGFRPGRARHKLARTLHRLQHILRCLPCLRSFPQGLGFDAEPHFGEA